MARFFVGQRVRILWSGGWPELSGEEGRIVAVAQDGGLTGGSEWITAPDCWGTAWAPHPSHDGGTRFAPNSSQLEPITPPHVAGSWEVIEQLLPNIREGVAA